ncbi:MAG: uracil-DNA glycosylase [Alphaproteobacteria bacterium]|nr:uracil-DNA glycosylase [Alphaproteobacteria bacterium]
MTSNSLNIKKCVEKDVLEWFLDNGVDEVLAHNPVNKTLVPEQKPVAPLQVTAQPNTSVQTRLLEEASDKPLIGTTQAIIEACALAKQAKTLTDLQNAIATFNGLAVKKTAMNMVFCDGNPKADIMVIGEAPGADEDRMGKPFVGASGQLLDKILKSIGLTRAAEDPHNATYISNILNWRPPGNRTPTPDEMKIALPFIERHIQLVQPKILVLVGNTPMKTILNTKEGIKKMRGRWHSYQTITPDLDPLEHEILALPTFHPAFLLRNPYEKKTVWQDMVMLQKKREELGITS